MTQTENTQLIDQLHRFFKRYYDEEIAELAEHYPREQRSLHINYTDVVRYNPDLADDILTHPETMLENFKEALQLYDLPIDVDLANAHVRVSGLPETIDVNEVSRCDNIGDLLDVRGQVQKISAVKPHIQEAAFVCQRCGAITTVSQSGELLQEPHECEGCERQGPFDIHTGQNKWTDHQYARLQQPPEQTQDGDGQTIDVHLEDDLIEEFDAGDRITLTGFLEIEEPGQDQRRDFDTHLSAHAVDRKESDYEDINVDDYLEEIHALAEGKRGDPCDLLVDSVNPKHQGDEDVKLAIALQLFGGWSREYPDGSHDRGDPHVLLLGDPGCGKSTFLQWADETAPRSAYASGKGASAAGMTAAAVADDFGDTEWSLEAGALVLADKGVACVDEIDKVKQEALSSMHDALESQRVHINKAGINTTLNARTSLLAAGNPKHGRFDPHQLKAKQIDLGPTLLSRFDLIFMVSDTPDEDRDRKIVQHMVNSRRAAGKHTRGESLTDAEKETVKPAIPSDVLRAYIAHARETCRPLMEEEVEETLSDYFVSFRQSAQDVDYDNPVPVTFRKLEAIQRIAEASARVRLSDTVELEDVQRAVDLIESSMRQVGYDPETGQFDADIVETGASKSQHDRRREIPAVIKQLNGATIEELSKETDISLEKLEHDIEALKENGRIYEENGALQKA
jgi:replicative DNA helicase Mcm